MRKVTSVIYDRVENNPKNSYWKIGYYCKDSNSFVEVARWRNSYSPASGANYGLLQIWSITFDAQISETQGGRNTCGGYNKPIANLEGCLWQLKKAFENRELCSDAGAFEYPDCGSVTSLLEALKNRLQKQYVTPLFLIDCNG